ncbi:MAG: glucosaminidase domain-containing protein [Candidatus Levybacteria bacterium]|nr:glucosaminidase domain-containing protein [Candidatus Levybacteria bacterium]
MRRLFLLGVYFTMTPLFIFSLIFYQLFLLHQHSNVSGKVLGASTQKVDYQAIPERSSTTEIMFTASEARVDVLKQFLARYESPLQDYSEYIVEVSDKYNLDYRLLPAIAMQESTLCKKAPAGSYNCWGFGIYGGKVTRFESFDQAIEAIARTLSQNYHAQGLIEPVDIMSRYTPSNTGEWAENVSYVMDRISASL